MGRKQKGQWSVFTVAQLPLSSILVTRLITPRMCRLFRPLENLPPAYAARANSPS